MCTVRTIIVALTATRVIIVPSALDLWRGLLASFARARQTQDSADAVYPAKGTERASERDAVDEGAFLGVSAGNDTYAVDTQYMFGPDLLLTPVLSEDGEVTFHVPRDDCDGARRCTAGRMRVSCGILRPMALILSLCSFGRDR